MIKSHKELAEHIAGKHVLHMLSLGKDSIATLVWLTEVASVQVTSVFFEFLAAHPDDARYFEYLRKKFPTVNFIKRSNGHELTNVAEGLYQSPIEVMTDLNKWEYIGFEMDKQADEIQADFICVGHSKYESVSRAINFYRRGLMNGKRIYPLGLLTKAQIIDVIRKSRVRLHPCYKFSPHSFDYPSYYKMRGAFIADPRYRESMMRVFPLLVLDEYRFERMMHAKG